MYEFKGTKVEDNKSEQILGKFKERFINESYPERILFINHLNKIEKTIPVEELRNVKLPQEYNIYMYHERLKTVYLTSFEEICMYIEQLEPWQDVDCLVFDEGFEWFLGITHNDTILLYGI